MYCAVVVRDFALGKARVLLCMNWVKVLPGRTIKGCIVHMGHQLPIPDLIAYFCVDNLLLCH